MTGDVVLESMETGTANDWFGRQLKLALISLYDPSVLRSSPLAELLGVAPHGDAVSLLRRALTDAIESLRPDQDIPTGSRTWRAYQVLRRRYIEGLNQRQVAADLGLSIRQLQREEILARDMLADALWLRHDLTHNQVLLTRAAADATQEGSEDAPEGTDILTDRAPHADESEPPKSPRNGTEAMSRHDTNGARQQELAQLRATVPVQMTDISEMVDDIIDTLAPLHLALAVGVEYTQTATGRCIPVQGPILRQALLNIVGAAIGHAPGGTVRIESAVQPEQVSIAIRSLSPAAATGAPAAGSPEWSESLATASELISMCQGSLELQDPAAATPASIASARPEASTAVSPASAGLHSGSQEPDSALVFQARVRLPIGEQLPVLVIDDNADTLQLMERFLSGSRYLFVGAQDSRRALALAEEVLPRAVVLDVMMPERDGWAVLGQLREHPTIGHIPVIVCTILAQRELAHALGAADFMRKPITRSALLAALDRQVVPPSPLPLPC